MKTSSLGSALVLGLLLCIGLIGLGFQIGHSVVAFRAMERTVTVKGLSEREVRANIAIWPITFNEADNDLNRLYDDIQKKDALIIAFLRNQGFPEPALSTGPPSVIDKQAQGYSGSQNIKFRYSGQSTITVYSDDVDRVLQSRKRLVDLGKEGIAFTGQDFQARTEFLYTALNRLKPEMVQEATRNAREVAEKFAKDSQSRLGKIKRASQGQFSINDRDSNTPYIKRVRVVSTITYYLAD